MPDLRNSRYCLFTILSYVDYCHKVNQEVLSKLNRRFRTLSQDKCTGDHSMLVKKKVMFKIDSKEKVRWIAQINLLHYHFGLEVKLEHLVPLLAVL